jgi:hypothetical protein
LAVAEVFANRMWMIVKVLMNSVRLQEGHCADVVALAPEDACEYVRTHCNPSTFIL